MEVQEIFDALAEHMIKGMMIHENLANYYDFLGLQGYKRCHEYHFMKETCEYRGLCRYYINHYDKLIKEPRFEAPEVIPMTWYAHIRQDVDMATKQKAVKDGLRMWQDWETHTKELYEQMGKELFDMGELAAYNKVNELICNVDKELKKVDRYVLNKEANNYDMASIVEEQKRKHHKYREMAKHIGVYIC